MATNFLQSLHHQNYTLLKLQDNGNNTPTSPNSSLFLKPNPPTPISMSISTIKTVPVANSFFSCNASSTTPTPTTTTAPSPSKTFSLDLLLYHLSNQDFFQADEETRRLLIILAGEPAQKRGYVFFSEVQFISVQDLKYIDELWREHSNNKFGYSVQKRVFEKKANRDFTKLFIKLGWMKKLEASEVEQYNYRSFPSEFMWELNDDTPEGHLPLTNALRGTQLFNAILDHPAFDDVVEEEKSSGDVDNGSVNGGVKDLKDGSSPSGIFSKRVFKPDYSF